MPSNTAKQCMICDDPVDPMVNSYGILISATPSPFDKPDMLIKEIICKDCLNRLRGNIQV